MAAEEVLVDPQQGIHFLEDESVDDFCKRVMTIIRNCQRHSSDLQGWQHYSDFSGVQFTMTRINKLLHNLISKIFIHQDIKLDINGFKLTDQFDIIKEGNDALCEKVNCDLDEASGIRKEADSEILDTTVRVIRGPVNQQTGQEVILRASRNVQKPQLFFSPKIDNSPKEPFIPSIKEKPNSLKPLAVMICIDPDGKEYYSHPYEYELQHWSPSVKLLQRRDPEPPLPLDQTPLLLVQTEEELRAMMDELRKVKEIAVDLEHHSFRTYQGLTCLLQISTRDKDFVVDPFPLRSRLAVLNEVFTDPTVTKVLHGSDNDVLWLQRDLGVYLVNAFDTHQAAIVLQYPQRSLASLLQTFCRLAVDKSYQRADWRIRPLPEDFLNYARLDSHFLLYVYDVMRNELIDKGNHMNNLIQATYNRSTEICLKRYEKPLVGPDSHMDLYRRSRKHFNTRQLYALQQLFLWRDRIARQQDESVDYVLPRHMLLQIAEILPKEMQGILACCNPIPSLVKTEQLTMHQIIRAARTLPFDKIASDLDQVQAAPLNQVDDMRDLKSALVSRHDLSCIEDDPMGLGTLVHPQETLLGDLFNPRAEDIRQKKMSALFGLIADSLRCKKNQLSRTTQEFMSPFERYKVYLENHLDDPEPPPPEAPKTNDEIRMQKIREHFLSLSQRSPARDSDRPKEESNPDQDKDKDQDQDQERLQRLQNQIAAMVTEQRKASDAPKKKKKKDKLAKMAKASESSPSVSEKEDVPHKTLKRKSSETADGTTIKKLREEEEEEGEWEEEEEEEVVEPFDYSKANFNIFHPKNKPRKNRRGFKQHFRGKGSQKSRGMKKSGERSMTWGSVKRE